MWNPDKFYEISNDYRLTDSWKYGIFQNWSSKKIYELLNTGTPAHLLEEILTHNEGEILCHLLERDFGIERRNTEKYYYHDHYLIHSRDDDRYSITTKKIRENIELQQEFLCLKNIYIRLYQRKQLQKKIPDDLFDKFNKLETPLLLICLADSSESDLSEFPNNEEKNYPELSLYFELSLYLGCTKIPKLFIEKYLNLFLTKDWLNKTAKLGNLCVIRHLLSYSALLDNDAKAGIVGFTTVFPVPFGGLGFVASLFSVPIAAFSYAVVAIGVAIMTVEAAWNTPYLKPDDDTLNAATESGNLSLVKYFLNEFNFQRSLDDYGFKYWGCKPYQETLKKAVLSSNLEMVGFLLDPSNKFDLRAAKAFISFLFSDIPPRSAENLTKFIVNDTDELDRFFNELFDPYHQKPINNLFTLFPNSAHQLINALLIKIDIDKFRSHIKDNFTLLKQYLPTIPELQKATFEDALTVIQKKSNLHNVRNAARILAQAWQDDAHPLSGFPHEMLVRIADKTVDNKALEEKTLEKIAIDNFGNP